MTPRFLIRRDTPAWRIQVWMSFAVSTLLSAHAVWGLPGETIDRTLVALGLFFVLSSAFTLAKTIRDNQHEKVDTPAWLVQVWTAFGISTLLTGWAILRLQIDPWHQWALIGASLFMLSSAFTLAKTLRDEHDAGVLEAAQRARAQTPSPATPVPQPAPPASPAAEGARRSA